MLTDLALTPFAATIRRLSAERRSGDLQVRSGKFAKTVFFDRGRVVFAASNLKKERLGEALVATGRITQQDFDRVSALMKGERRPRFGEALVQAGVMDRDEVGHSVARQVKRIVLSLFELSEGAAFFDERPCVIPLEYMVSLSVHRMLYVGIKSMASQRLVLAGIGDLDCWVTLAAVPPFPFGIRKCTAEEREILEQAKRRVTMRRLAWEPGGLSFPRLRLVYALLASGVLRDADRPDAPHPIIQMETSTFMLSALQRRPDPSLHDAIRQEVEQELDRSAHLDREKWLRLSRTAPRDELTKALEEKMERYHALLDAVGEDEGLRTDIELILGRASTMLRLARQAPAPETPKPEAPAAEMPDAEVPAAEMPDAEAPAEQPAPAPAVAAPAAAPAPGDASQSSFAGSAQVEHLVMEGQVRMTVSDFANAANVFAKVVELQPDVGAHRVRLAIAMACYPRMAKQAERQFYEAVRLEPDNADIHYQFALYYKTMKVRSRAISELRTSLSLNPRHRQARAELESLSPKDSALTSLKKLFK